MNFCVCNAKGYYCSTKHDDKCHYRIITQLIGNGDSNPEDPDIEYSTQSNYKYKYYIKKKLWRFGLTYNQERYVLDVYIKVRIEFARIESTRKRIMKVDFILNRILERIGLQVKTLKSSLIMGNLGKYNKIWGEIEEKLFGRPGGRETLNWNEIEDELTRSYKILWSI